MFDNKSSMFFLFLSRTTEKPKARLFVVVAFVMLLVGGFVTTAFLSYPKEMTPQFPASETGAARVPEIRLDTLWKRFSEAGMLILPDSDETKCAPGVLDGGGFVVELIANQKYRT